jgi:hypothetical protein
MKAVVFTLAVAMLVLSASVGYQVHLAREQRHALCVAVYNQNVLITKSLARAKKNTPKLAYYQNHPAELRRALDDIDAQIKTFAPRVCR